MVRSAPRAPFIITETALWPKGRKAMSIPAYRQWLWENRSSKPVLAFVKTFRKDDGFTPSPFAEQAIRFVNWAK